jgi:hypothetical protein
MESRLEELLKRRRFSPMIELISADGIEPELRFSAAGTS